MNSLSWYHIAGSLMYILDFDPDLEYFSEMEIEWCMCTCTQHLDSGIATFTKLLLNYCEPSVKSTCMCIACIYCYKATKSPELSYLGCEVA